MNWRVRGLLALGAVATVGTGVAAGVRHAERRRSQALAERAARLGLVFSGRDDVPVTPAIRQLPLFARSWLKKGRDGVVHNVAHGVVGDRWVVVFDYDFYPGGPWPCFTVVAVPCDGAALPAFQLQREDGARATPHLPGPARRLDDAAPRPAYVLRARDEATAARLRGAPLAAFLAAQPGPLGVEAAGDWIIVYQARIQADGLDALLSRALDVGGLVAGALGSRAR